jgi:hypothetical protein
VLIILLLESIGHIKGLIGSGGVGRHIALQVAHISNATVGRLTLDCSDWLSRVVLRLERVRSVLVEAVP